MGERDGLHALRAELAGLTAKYLVADGRTSQAPTPSLNPISTSYDSIAAPGRGRSKCGPGSRGSEPPVTPPLTSLEKSQRRSRSIPANICEDRHVGTSEQQDLPFSDPLCVDRRRGDFRNLRHHGWYVRY